MKRVLIGVLSVTLFSMLLVAFMVFYWHRQVTRPVVPSGQVFEVHQGESLQSVVRRWSQTGWVHWPKLMAAYLDLEQKKLKKGEYWLPAGSSVQSIYLQISEGRGYYYRSFTIVPGWNLSQLRAALAKNPYLRHDAANVSNAVWHERLGLSKDIPSPEGLFLPETYFFTKGTSDWIILQTAHRGMMHKLHATWAKRSIDLPYENPYLALIAASLIEKEVFDATERPLVASVIVNRLRKKMRLQIDPTVIYGLGDRYQGTLHKTDLQTATPYNTYIIPGLPPTPIAIPSISAITAAVQPAKTNYLYFVARGSHKQHCFSETYAKHQIAVARYMAIQRGSHGSISNLVKDECVR